MNLFLKRISIFLFPLFVVVCFYEIILRDKNVPNIYSFKNQLLDENYDGIVLGNSHALRGIIAENINAYEVISLANVSQSINIDYEWLKETITRKDLKVVILNYSIPTLTGNLYVSKESWRLKNYNLYTDLQLDYSFKNNLELFTGKQSDNLQFILESKKRENNYLSKGSSPVDVTLKSTELKYYAQKAIERHSNKVNIEQNKVIFDKIIDLSIQHDFDLIVVTPPTTINYRSLISKKLKKEFNKVLVERCKKKSNVLCLNLMESKRYDNSMFKDSDHLNLRGATIFTEEINTFLKQRVNN